VYEIFRRALAEDGISPDGSRAAGTGALLKSYGSTDPRDARRLNGKIFCLVTLYCRVICDACSAAEKEHAHASSSDGTANSHGPAGHCPGFAAHVAIISDGNGRWATSRGLPRSAGHRAGAESARRVIEAAPRIGIHTLTLFRAFRPRIGSVPLRDPDDLAAASRYLLTETTHCIDEGVRLSIIGRRDRLPDTSARPSRIRSRHGKGARLHLRLAVDYSPRSHLHAACRFYNSHRAFAPNRSVAPRRSTPGGSTEVDLLMYRRRATLSDFLCGNALSRNSCFLPKTGGRSFTVAHRMRPEEFSRRERTRGALPDAIAG